MTHELTPKRATLDQVKLIAGVHFAGVDLTAKRLAQNSPQTMLLAVGANASPLAIGVQVR